ncbi:hypothetical protein CBR_g31847 [Chara braunii]|uniref:Uncharacterized protein n=1 Tax=Chara braunii TaxID=69332 RepID=A0A388LFU8_CHABU|nr:hypothetical protein CBR_g31847 [Chara braunii]|eukprot:GBG81171.1 hypothetical protein CBR_g31847 [Chara braunii]
MWGGHSAEEHSTCPSNGQGTCSSNFDTTNDPRGIEIHFPHSMSNLHLRKMSAGCRRAFCLSTTYVFERRR